jgi:RHS repeat-associated protein
MEEGRVLPFNSPSGMKYAFEYTLKDHLGNSRVTYYCYRDSVKPGKVQVAEYYPFGLVMKQYNSEPEGTGYEANKYLYNGKELQSDNLAGSSLNWYDYGARMYMPEIGRWGVLDIQAETYQEFTPYRYGFNNPLRFADINGETEEERISAIAFARSLLKKKYNTPYSELGYSSKHWAFLDCSGFVRLAVRESTTLGDFFDSPKIRNISGVQNILDSGIRQVGIEKIRDGDLIIIKSGSRINGHIGFVTNVKRLNGKVISYDILHSEDYWETKDEKGIVVNSGGGYVTESHVDVGSGDDYAREKYQHRFYQWDTTLIQQLSQDNQKSNQNKPNLAEASGVTWKQIYDFMSNALSLNPNIKIIYKQ